MGTKERPGRMDPANPPEPERDLPAFYTIPECDLPMPLDTLIKVGMLADVDRHGDGLPISGISIALCPRRDPAGEGSGEWAEGIDGDPPTAVEVGQIEAALLPYAVFGFEKGHWAYGRQIKRVYEKGVEHEG